MIKILDMKPQGYYVDKTPYYNFHNPFHRIPTILDKMHASVEDAYKEGLDWAKKYEQDQFPGGMACCLGVTHSPANDGYKAVVSYYYSNT